MTRRQLIPIAVLLLVAGVLPLVVSDYGVYQCNLGLVYAIALPGLNMLTGYNGQFSLGHGVFYAFGAYTAAVLMTHYGVPYWATLPAAFVACFVFGFLVGVLENVLGAFVIGNELKLAVALVLIVGVLVVKPSGFFGKVFVTRV